MSHIHEESETYYLDQLCLIALSGAFGGVCLTLYFWQVPMLNLMLGSGTPRSGLTPAFQLGGPRVIQVGARFSF